MIKYFLTALVIISLIIPANSQILNNKGGQVLLKGFVRDEITGNPVSVNIEFKSSSGSKTKVTSNSKDGSYEQILKADESYEVLLSNFDVIRKTDKVQIINTTQYKEQSQDFTVKRLTPGLQLYKQTAFDKSSHSVSDETKNIFNELQDLMKFNRNVKFEVVITGDYQATKAQTATDPKAKKAKKTKAPKKSTKTKNTKKDAASAQATDSTQIKQASDKVHALVDSRASEIQSLLDTWARYKERVSIKKDYDFSTPNANTYNLIISVTSIEKTFN